MRPPGRPRGGAHLGSDDLTALLDGSGPASLEAPPLDAYPEIVWEAGPSARRVNLDTLTPEEVQSWQPGETVLRYRSAPRVEVLEGTVAQQFDAARAGRGQHQFRTRGQRPVLT